MVSIRVRELRIRTDSIRVIMIIDYRLLIAERSSAVVFCRLGFTILISRGCHECVFLIEEILVYDFYDFFLDEFGFADGDAWGDVVDEDGVRRSASFG